MVSMKSSFGEYKIRFSVLKPGLNHFDFLVEHPFFSRFPNSIVKEGRVWINLELDKQNSMFILNFTIKGSLQLPCDRCLELVDLQVKEHFRQIIRFGKEAYEETDEVIILSHSEHELDLSHYIYECISLLVPFKVVHGESGDASMQCNKDVLDALERHSAGQVTTDPRWAELNKIIGSKKKKF